MKKLIFIIVLLVGMLFAQSGHNGRVIYTDRGSLAPTACIADASDAISREDLQGDYVLLTFWSSTDAQSRVDCNRYTAWVDQLDSLGRHIKHVGINFDSNDRLFEEIVRLDNMVADNQHNVSSAAAEQIIREYGLSHGFGSVLIDPEGVVVAYNPSRVQLASL